MTRGHSRSVDQAIKSAKFANEIYSCAGGLDFSKLKCIEDAGCAASIWRSPIKSGKSLRNIIILPIRFYCACIEEYTDDVKLFFIVS